MAQLKAGSTVGGIKIATTQDVPEKATQAEAVSGTDNNKYMTPFLVSTVLDSTVKSVNNKTGDVVLNAEDVGAPTIQQHNQLAQEVSDLDDTVAAHLADIATLVQYGHVQHGIITATVLAEDWEGDEAPYTNTVSTPSVLATDNPIVDVIDIDGSLQDAWGTIFRVVTSDGLIIFYALEKPDVDLQVQIKVVR